MARHNELGEKGELAASAYLKCKGYEILAKNWRDGKYELDLIAKKSGRLILVEVKTRSTSIENVRDVMSQHKENCLIEAADRYLQTQDEYLDCQIDLLILEKKRGEFNVMHIENAIGQK